MPYYTVEIFVPIENLSDEEVRRMVSGMLHAKDPSVHVVALAKRRTSSGIQFETRGFRSSEASRSGEE